MRVVPLLYVLGMTNAGKSSFLNSMKSTFGERVALVEVGKQMRAKYLDPSSPHYDPDYFKGQAAPEHTQAEAWNMHLDGVRAGALSGAELILVDGQPRDPEQVDMIQQDMIGTIHWLEGTEVRFEVSFLLIHCEHAQRVARLSDRFPDAGTDEAQRTGYRLGIERLAHDYQSMYRTTTAMARMRMAYEVLDTTSMVGVEGLSRLSGVCPTVFDMYTG